MIHNSLALQLSYITTTLHLPPPLSATLSEPTPAPPIEILHLCIQSLRNPHQQSTEKEQTYEGDAHNDSKDNPIIFYRVDTLKVTNLNGEITCHKTDWQE